MNVVFRLVKSWMLLGEIGSVNGSALVGAGLLSVVLFPPVALALLRDADGNGGGDAAGPVPIADETGAGAE